MTDSLLTSEQRRFGRLRRGEADPEMRVGICCGCGVDGLALFKVPEIYRYRCAECFQLETGYRHHLSPPASRIVLP